jgi:thiol:disulfide interchange protein DsbD
MRAAGFLFLLAAWISPGSGQEIENPVIWSLKVNPPRKIFKPGDRFTGVLTAQIQDGWHVYSTTQGPGGPQATRISLPEGQAFRLAGKIVVPKFLTGLDPNFNMEVEYYAESATFQLPVTVIAHAPPGRHTLRVEAFFQTCDERQCLPPAAVPVDAIVEVAGVAATAATPAVVPPPPLASPTPPATAPVPSGPTGQQAESMAGFLWLAMVFGALSLLTPCVFPMVPITVSYFANHSAATGRGSLGNAGVFTCGIVLTFVALGLALALVLGAGGVNQFAANPWVNLLITAVFLGFALNLFGAFEVAIPGRLLTRLHALTHSSGGRVWAAHLAMGLVFTLTSFTCTAPFIGTLLVTAAQGNWKWPLLGMLAFSSVFAAPFFLLALMPQWMNRLPRAGSWMQSVKVVMGIAEVAAALKFLSNADLVWRWGILTREVVLACWVALALATAVYVLWPRRSGLRFATALASLGLAALLTTGLFGQRLGELESFLPPAQESALHGELPWIMNDYQGALAQARRQGRLVLIDFTGYTCTNCRWMEANMFPRPEVKRRLESYVRVRLYTDGVGELYSRQQNLEKSLFQTVALPYYAVVDPQGRPLATFAGLTRKTEEFLAFLDQPLAR